MTRIHTCFGALVLFTVAILAAPAPVCANSVFDRDMSFGDQGRADVWFDAGQQNQDTARMLLRRPDGDIDVVAQIQTAVAGKYGVGLQRVTPAGVKVGAPRIVANVALIYVSDAVRASNGKIVVLGARVSDADNTKVAVVVMRFNADYSDDTGFDGIGWRSYDIVDSGIQRSASPLSIASLASGDIFVVGEASTDVTWGLKLVLAENGSVRRSCSADNTLRYSSVAVAASTRAGSADDAVLAANQGLSVNLLMHDSADNPSCIASGAQISVDVASMCPHPGNPAPNQVDPILLRGNDASSSTASFLVATGTRVQGSSARAAVIDVDLDAAAALQTRSASCGLGPVATTRIAQSDDRQHVFLTGWRCRDCGNGNVDNATAALKRNGSALIAYPAPLPFNGVPGFQRLTSFFAISLDRMPVLATPGQSASFVLAGTRTLTNGTDDDVVLTRHALVAAMFENGLE